MNPVGVLRAAGQVDGPENRALDAGDVLAGSDVAGEGEQGALARVLARGFENDEVLRRGAHHEAFRDFHPQGHGRTQVTDGLLRQEGLEVLAVRIVDHEVLDAARHPAFQFAQGGAGGFQFRAADAAVEVGVEPAQGRTVQVEHELGVLDRVDDLVAVLVVSRPVRGGAESRSGPEEREEREERQSCAVAASCHRSGSRRVSCRPLRRP